MAARASRQRRRGLSQLSLAILETHPDCMSDLGVSRWFRRVSGRPRRMDAIDWLLRVFLPFTQGNTRNVQRAFHEVQP